MFSEAIQKRLTELPFRPGVYLMKNAAKKVIYVGKAKVLAHRVRSYFDGKEKPGHRAATLMLPYIREIEWIVTDTEEEAFILEANLIRKHKPIYNVRLKDDKHYPYIAIDMRDPFPRLFLSRHASTRFRCFGPYPSSKAFRTLIDISARLFKMRECKLIFPLAKSQRPCLNYHIGRCLAPCANLCSQEEYARNVGEMVKVLEGKRNDLLSEWTREMEDAVLKLDFETAAKKRDAIEALQATTTFQKADTTDTTLKLDVIAVRRNGNLATAVIFEYRQGVISGRRHFQLECDQEQDESEIFCEMLSTWYEDGEGIPSEIAISNAIADEDCEQIEEELSERAHHKVNIAVPKRGERVQFMKLALANAEMLLVEAQASVKHFDEVDQSVFDLQRELGLSRTPFRIECVDISHLAGTHTVASLVSFKNGRPDKKNYRKFIIKTVSGVDDFASMREVMTRRIRRLEEEGTPMPDLWVCDGGKGQVDATMQILRELGHDKDLPLIGLAKRLEEIVFPDDRKSIVLHRTSAALKLLQNARDEAHRFAITYQRSKRKEDLRVAWLNLPGIGDETRIKILSRYKCRSDFLKAPPEDIQEIFGKKRGLLIRDKIAEYNPDAENHGSQDYSY